MTRVAMAMAVSIAHFIRMERLAVGYGVFAARRHGAVIAVVGVKVVVHMAIEVIAAMVPRAGTNEDAAVKPLRAVVAVGSAVVRSVVIVAIGAARLHSNTDTDADLGLCFWCRHHEAKSGYSS